MNLGIKIAKRGFNVLKLDDQHRNPLIGQASPHLLYALALPYLFGARLQIKRYKASISDPEKNSVTKTYECLHETSTLFEDLCTVAKYIRKCKNDHRLHHLWIDIRNHIRHDFREEFDNENKAEKNNRSRNLKLDHRLQTNIGFSVESIKVGEITVEIQTIIEYLDWAENIITDVLNDAKNQDKIKNA